jgi:hypothetical protein
MASVMGGHYPAGGINLGPAMTFGFIAGEDLAGGMRDENRHRIHPLSTSEEDVDVSSLLAQGVGVTIGSRS